MEKQIKEEVTEEKKEQFPKAASVLVDISSVLLVFFGILAIIFHNWIIATLEENLGKTALTGITLIELGILWIILSFFLSLTKNVIIKTSKKSWMIFLILLALITGLTGRIESGLMTLIAAIIYLAKAKK